MSYETIGLIAGLIVIASAVPYCLAIVRRDHPEHPVMVTWLLWTFIGLAVLVTYWSSGARASIWTAVFGFTNPLLVVLLAWWQLRKSTASIPGDQRSLKTKLLIAWAKLHRTDRWCFRIGVVSLLVWAGVHNKPELAQYALYLALVADACAAIPTIRAHFASPAEHPPLAWGMFCVASFLNLFAVSEATVASYAMPAYMCIGSAFLTLPLVVYRIRHRIPLNQWY